MCSRIPSRRGTVNSAEQVLVVVAAAAVQETDSRATRAVRRIGVQFEERDRRELKGVPRTWDLYAAC
jgi:hypothetical protein